jgi:hypothetical protein
MVEGIVADMTDRAEECGLRMLGWEEIGADYDNL